MNIIQAPHHSRPNKRDAAELLNIETYDTALPQRWLDEFVNEIVKVTGKPRDEIYGLALSSFVWCYDDSIMGYPYPMTITAYGWLKCYDIAKGTHYADECAPAHQFNVLEFA